MIINITKQEWVLNRATVLYGSASELRATLEYDFSQGKNYSYKGHSMDEIIHHLAMFVSRLWQMNLLLEEANELHNRKMHISGKLGGVTKQDIREPKQDIEGKKKISNRTLVLSLRTKQNIEKLFSAIGYNYVFGRSEIMNVLGITPSPASELIKKMLTSGIIEPVKGYGKGKYRFLK